MKPIVLDKQFAKNYSRRIAPNPRLVARFSERLRMFAAGERGSALKDHTLKGAKLGLRAFSVGGDLRVVYHETTTQIVLLDVGTHNQVY